MRGLILLLNAMILNGNFNFCNLFKKQYKDILNCEVIEDNINIDNILWQIEGTSIVNTPSLFVNDVSEALIDNGDSYLLIGYTFAHDGIRFSIRSHRYINSIAVAKLINDKAGGHQTASGAFITWDDWNNIHIKQQTSLFKLLNTY